MSVDEVERPPRLLEPERHLDEGTDGERPPHQEREDEEIPPDDPPSAIGSHDHAGGLKHRCRSLAVSKGYPDRSFTRFDLLPKGSSGLFGERVEIQAV